MTTAERFADLYHHMAWADAVVWSAVLESEKASGDSQVLDTLFHMAETQHAFLDAWNERPFTRTDRTDHAEAASMCRWVQSFHAAVSDTLQTLNPTELESPMVLPWAHYFGRMLGHEPHTTTREETLNQLVLHTMHHRGQVARRLRELDDKAPATDYIIWLWAGRPNISWPD